MNNIEQSLAAHPFAEGLSQSIISTIASCGKHVSFRANEYIFREGNQADQFYLLQGGAVALEMNAPGPGVFTFMTIKNGQPLGLSWLSPPFRWAFDARTLEVTQTIAFDAKCLHEKFEADHHVGYEILKRLVEPMTERMQAARVQSADLFEAPDRRAQRQYENLADSDTDS